MAATGIFWKTVSETEGFYTTWSAVLVERNWCPVEKRFYTIVCRTIGPFRSRKQAMEAIAEAEAETINKDAA